MNSGPTSLISSYHFSLLVEACRLEQLSFLSVGGALGGRG